MFKLINFFFCYPYTPFDFLWSLWKRRRRRWRSRNCGRRCRRGRSSIRCHGLIYRSWRGILLTRISWDRAGSKITPCMSAWRRGNCWGSRRVWLPRGCYFGAKRQNVESFLCNSFTNFPCLKKYIFILNT